LPKSSKARSFSNYNIAKRGKNHVDSFLFLYF
jgi:hypothetical protein